MKNRVSFSPPFGVFLAVFLLISPAVHAQTGQGQIVGTVTDSTGAVIPAVKIVAVNRATGFNYSSQTNEQGIYRSPYVNPGIYEITFEADGFKRLVRNNIQVRSTETTRVNVELEIGTLVETVEVSAAAQLLETETSTTGDLVAGEILTTVPTPQMKIQTILYYMAGVTNQSGIGHVAGQRSRSFQATMDGVSGMEPVRGEVSTNTFLATVQHNMAEVKLLTTALPAEYGHSGGGIMNVAYKSGTNQLHGLAEERYIYPGLIHRNWGDAARPTGGVNFHLITGTMSGPVVLPGYNGRNKTFWLAGFQRHHERASENNNREVPSAAELGGDFSFGGIGFPVYDPASLVQLPDGSYSRTQFANNQIPTSRFSNVANNFLGFEPFRSPDNRNNQASLTPSGPQDNLSHDTKYRSYRTGSDFKVDHSFSDRHKFFWRFSNYQHRSWNGRWNVAFNNKIFDYRKTPIPINSTQWVISDSITINPTTVNEFRLGYNRRKYTRVPESLNEDWAGQLGIPNVGPQTMPNFGRCTNLNCTGQTDLFADARFPEGAETDVTENMSFQNNVTLVRGRHTFKVGYELLRTRANSRINAEPSGIYAFGGTEFRFTPNTGNHFASFLLGGVRRAEFTNDLATWLPRWWTNSLYFQTDWKVTNKLTLNLGVRWQYETPFETKYGQQSQFDPTAVDPLTGNIGALLHPSGPLASSDRNNFQPRLGMAYNFKQNWVLRAGFAVNTLDLWTAGLRENFDEYIGTAVIQPAPGDPDIAFHIDDGPPDISLNIASDGSAPFIGTNYGGRTASWYDPGMRAPYVMNWNAGIQWQTSATTMIEINYQGSSGVGLLNSWNVNVVPLDISSDVETLDTVRRSVQNYKPFPHFGNINHYSNYGHNSYHSGTIKFEKRYSNGLTLTSFYTRSKAIDEDSNDAGAGGVTFYNRVLEKGRSDYDVTNRWVTYSTYELPFGRGKRWGADSNAFVNAVLGNWELSNILTLIDGRPFGVTHSGSGNVYLPGTLRPDMAPGKTYDDIELAWDSHGPNRHNRNLIDPWMDVNAFAAPPSFTPGSSGRNIITGPGTAWWQVSLSKSFLFTERFRGMLRLDMNNPIKYYFFNPPTSALNFSNTANFGKITNNQGSFSGIGGRLYMHMIFRVEF